ncbi:MAG: hypothetical protein WBE14_23025, partial [Xanthobacteraceae bacterium]
FGKIDAYWNIDDGTGRVRGASIFGPPEAAAILALVLGGVGIRLADLVKLYAGIARLGLAVPLSERMDAGAPEARRLMEPAAAWYVSNVLLGSPPPENGVGRPHRLQDRHQLRLPRRLVGRL